MVQATLNSTTPLANPSSRIPQWLESVAGGRSDAELAVVRRAAELAVAAHAGQRRASGEPYVDHSFAVAAILHDLRLDHQTMAAALLHDVVEDTDVALDEIREAFGAPVAQLVDGVTKMDVIQEIQDPGDTGLAQETVRIESLRKMLLAMVADVRVVLIKLADRLHNLRTLKALPDSRRVSIARETLDIFAPLANRLGVWHLKWELEDLSLRYLEPQVYKDLARKLAERRIDRERYIERFIREVREHLVDADVDAEIYGRPKHIYSIWNKMRRKDLDFEHIFDVRAVRILVETVQDCYAALGVVHTLWTYIPGEFDDYIATPKENNYQSIHTAVVGPQGKVVEVQIRTREMHEHNELGVAAHWRYKEGGKDVDSLDEKVLWLRQLLEWKDDVADASEFVDRVRAEVFEERVYVFTPKGQIIDLPRGSTPVDFAYAIHTEVGHRCRGARINGRIVPLTHVLKTGEQVEVLSVKNGGPSRDWMNPHLGYVKTPRALSRIKRWYRLENWEQNVATGRQMVERELQRVALSKVSFEKLARKLKLNGVEEMFVQLAEGELKPSRVVNAASEIAAPLARETKPAPPPATRRPSAKPGGEFEILGVGNLLTSLANCCRPVPGDPITGFITRGRGVTIHKQDCRNILHARTQSPERLVEVTWGGRDLDHLYPVDIVITAYDRQGLLRDISAVLTDAKVNVLAVNTTTDKRQHVAHMTLTVEVPDIENVSRVLSRIGQLPNVTDARRRG